MVQIITTGVMLTMLVISIVTDLRTGKIYNLVTMPCALVGLVLGLLADLPTGLNHFYGVAVTLVVVMLLTPLAKIGGGDAKLLMAVGALQGLHFAIWTLLLTGVAGGVLAVITMIRRRALKPTAATMAATLWLRTAGGRTDLTAWTATGRMPYSLAIAAGAVTALILHM